MSLDIICPVCQSTSTYEVGEVTRFEPPFFIRRCAECQSSYQYPAPKNSDAFYSDEYYSGRAGYSYIDERKIDKYARYVWDARIRHLRKFQTDGIFIDVGCSFGGLTRSAAEYFQAYGIDISAYAVEEGNQFSKQIFESEKNETVRETIRKNFCGLFQGNLLKFPVAEIHDSSVAVISMIEVAEHLENPAEHFQKAFELLKPGGVFIVQTANMTAFQAESAGLGYHYYLPGHLTYFSQEGLETLLRKIGFSRVIQYIPVEFGLLPKLLKMRGGFTSWRDHFRWFKTAWYHYSSYLRYKNAPLTSSLVVYAIK